jgi:predicted acylesterase/phospholipase RssA
MKRAITLGGGGPAAGLQMGALIRLAEAGVTFDVWALSCIGAWVGIVYHQFDGSPVEQAEKTRAFFHNVFRNDASYSRFPTNTVFGPALGPKMRAMTKFLMDPRSYQNLWLPREMMEALNDTIALLLDRSRWNAGDFDHWMLNSVLAVNPFSRFFTSLMYLSNFNGLTKMYYPQSSFLKAIKFDNLYRDDKPFLYHNAWNLTKKRLELFSNKPHGRYKNISAQSLCACSALPFIEETVTIDGDTYCEGALVQTINFENLLEDHPDLDEIWVIRIIDTQQIRAPKTITDGLGNLCMLFAGALGEDDVHLFKYHARELGWKGKIIEVRVATDVSYEWSHSNLNRAIEDGYEAADEAIIFHSFLTNYLAGDKRTAKRYAHDLKDYTLGFLARALAADTPAEAAPAIESLIKFDRAWRRSPRAELGKIIYEDKTLDLLTRDLAAAGLPDAIETMSFPNIQPAHSNRAVRKELA